MYIKNGRIDRLLFYAQISHTAFIDDIVFVNNIVETLDCKFIGSIKNDLADCYVLLTNNNELIFSFRGSDSFHDLLQNFKLQPIKLFKNNKIIDKNDLYFHSGYYNLYCSIADDIIKYIQEYKKQYKKITFVGYSLGGSLAVLATYHIYNYLQMVNIEFNNIDCVIFGTPGMANKNFRNIFTKIVPRSISVHNIDDITSYLPSVFYEIPCKYKIFLTSPSSSSTSEIIYHKNENKSSLLPKSALYHKYIVNHSIRMYVNNLTNIKERFHSFKINNKLKINVF